MLTRQGLLRRVGHKGEIDFHRDSWNVILINDYDLDADCEEMIESQSMSKPWFRTTCDILFATKLIDDCRDNKKHFQKLMSKRTCKEPRSLMLNYQTAFGASIDVFNSIIPDAIDWNIVYWKHLLSGVVIDLGERHVI